MSSDSLPLPYGWVQELDPNTNHPFWVDTKADPPRAIWTHPYEDEQYLREHPDVREKAESLVRENNLTDGPTSRARRHSFNGHDSTSMVPGADNSAPDSSASNKGKEKRGFFGRLKDKAVGSKEEREAYKREMARLERERQRRYAEMLSAQQARYEQQQALANQRPYAGPSCPPRYGPPAGNPYGYGPGYGAGYGGGYGYGYGGYPSQRSSGSAMPLLGGLVGGLLLGDLLF